MIDLRQKDNKNACHEAQEINNYNIRIPKKITSKIKEFEKKEWHVADIEHYGKDRNFVRKKYKFIASNKNGKIFGILDLIIEANVALIEGVIVDSEFRGNGVGRQLVIEAENFSKKNKCNKVWLETDEDWDAAKFYKKIGYKITGIHERHYLDKRGLIFTKYL